MMIINNGILKQAIQKPSPNFDNRPCDVVVDLVVIHNISLPPNNYMGSYIEDFFCNKLDYSKDPYFEKIKDLKVSSHLLIKRNGDLIQFVNLKKRAWHAGVSNYKGRKKCNDFSIGIEVEGSDYEPFEDRQYIMLNRVLESLYHNFPIDRKKVVGHSDISLGRKTDPGPYFNWGKVS